MAQPVNWKGGRLGITCCHSAEEKNKTWRESDCPVATQQVMTKSGFEALSVGCWGL